MSGSIAPPINGLDPSIPLRVGQGVAPLANPLATFGEFANIRNALTQNRAMEAGIKQTETGTSGMQQEQALRRLGLATSILGGILAENPNGVPASAVASAMAGFLTNGLLKREEVAPTLANLPMGDDPQSMAERTQLLRQMHFQGLGIAEQIARTRGVPTTMTNGQDVQPGLMSEQGFRGAGGTVPQFPSRSELATRVPTGVVPPGQPNAGATITGPLGSVTPPELAGPASPFGTGRIPPALRNPGAAAPQAAAGPPNGGNVVTGLGPAATAAAGTTGTGSAAAFQDIATQAVAAKDRLAGLQTMLAEKSKFVTGPGQENIKLGQQVLQRFAPGLASALGITPESLAANESFDKIAARIASSQGAGSDARLSVAQSANPSSKLSEAGVELILKQLIGNEDYIAARAKLADAYPDKTDRAGFEAKIGSNLDPRVFQFARMDAGQRREFFNTLKDKAAFKKAYGWAESNGLLSAP